VLGEHRVIIIQKIAVKTKTVKDMEKMMKTNNQTNKKLNTKKTKKNFMSKLVFWK